MNIELKEILVKDLVQDYINDNENGVVGYGGKLNIRPKYQREFVYKDTQRDEVINTVRKDFPLNVMYWVKSDNNEYEVMDGQQRTISICEYIAGKFSINYQYFHNLEENEKQQILDYKLMIYFCEGNDKEKLDWFKTINIAGEQLTNQELRNAIYTGTWLTDAKKHFSKSGCVAYNLGSDYLKGSPIRQDYLETVIKWISKNEIEDYMSSHQHTPTAFELWSYYQNVISWVQSIFTKYRKEMKGIDWGFLYNDYHSNSSLNPVEIEKQIKSLMEDEDVNNKKGIYTYILSKEEKHLSIRAFTPKQIREAYERQNGICVKCGEHFDLKGMEADHITPWSKGGRTTADNCQMLCKDCNRRKSDI